MNRHVRMGSGDGGSAPDSSAESSAPGGGGRWWRLVAALVLSLPLAVLIGQSPTAANDLPVDSDQDITEPEITSFAISPSSVDVTVGNATFGATATASDDLSGVANVQASYRLPGTSRSISFSMSRGGTFGNPTSGDVLSGTWQTQTTVSPNTANGTYEFSSLVVRDVVGNYRYYYPADIGTIGAPQSITVVSNADSLPPTITSYGATPNPVDVSSAAQEISAELYGTDDISGLVSAFAYYRSPNNQQALSLNMYPVDGDPGHLIGRGWVERHSDPGTWSLTQICAYDAANNVTCYYSSNDSLDEVTGAADLVVINTDPDTNDPGATALRLDPTSIDVTTGSAKVDVEVDVNDDLSGVRYAYVRFTSPATPGATPQVITRYAFAFAESIVTTQYQSDGRYDSVYDDSLRLLGGTLTGSVTFPQYDRSGEWKISLCVYDQVYNDVCYDDTTTPSIDDIGPGSLVVEWNRAPVVTVTGIDQDEYEAGSEPSAFGCTVTDEEDGVITDVVPAVVVDGDVVTVTCSYTDQGINGGENVRTGTNTRSFTIVQPPAVQCLPGTFSDTGAEPCTPTPAGSFTDVSGATEATLCAVGTYQNAVGQISCLAAPAGSYVDRTGATQATLCAVGTYQNAVGQTSCLAAPAGSYVDQTGATQATLCPVGTYQNAVGGTSCLAAPAGSYVDQTGATQATLCPAGFTTAAVGSTSVDDCVPIEGPEHEYTTETQGPASHFASGAAVGSLYKGFNGTTNLDKILVRREVSDYFDVIGATEATLSVKCDVTGNNGAVVQRIYQTRVTPGDTVLEIVWDPNRPCARIRSVFVRAIPGNGLTPQEAADALNGDGVRSLLITIYSKKT